jgi:hypothetical protein
MKPNPQTLINLPGAGNAEKELRKAGLWRLTPEERLECAISDLVGAVDIAQDFAKDLEYQWNKMEDK